MNEIDLGHLRRAIDVAHQAVDHGNQPFGAILVNEKNQILMEAENTIITSRDVTGHAETNLIREATPKYTLEELALCTLYASAEPCAMCAGAIHWSHIGRLVFALSEEDIYKISGPSPENLRLPCKEVFQHSQQTIEVIGPCPELDVEARAVLKRFWK
jgi:tRNA(Arg) A34 adenosine deaminase TadA